MGQLCQITVPVQQKKITTGPAKKMTVEDEFAIIEAIVDNPALRLREIQVLVYETAENSISVPAICVFLYHSGFSSSHCKTEE